MKRNPISKPALALLITGLLITTTLPIIGRHFMMPDFLRGFLTGVGLLLESLALICIQRRKRDSSCAFKMDEETATGN